MPNDGKKLRRHHWIDGKEILVVVRVKDVAPGAQIYVDQNLEDVIDAEE